MGEFTVVGLRVVREAARHGSFSTAAERLGYTQSAVSRQIALMEQAAGRVLFERQARGVRVTEAGRVVLRHAETVLAELDAARAGLSDLGERPERVRVGAFSTAMAALVPRAIAASPRVRVPLREGLSARLAAAVARSRLDLAVVVAPPNAPDGIDLLPLVDDPLLVALPRAHALAGETAVPPQALRDEQWIAGSADPASTLLGTWSDDPQVAFVARDWTAKLGLVAAGLGVTVVPGLAVTMVPPTVALTRIDHPAAVRPTTIVRRPEATPATQEFTEALLDTATELATELRHRLR
ncbi:LysR family transcriptional regulator [Actinomadura hibisca]|uniref:LysR family transcriptional regulator n=1 Tax=Actinomadura hibisca TaxID=68565 RepID=UPI000834A638|nr:LysR family transcriptional regulator [Actinomadura hibisca]